MFFVYFGCCYIAATDVYRQRVFQRHLVDFIAVERVIRWEIVFRVLLLNQSGILHYCVIVHIGKFRFEKNLGRKSLTFGNPFGFSNGLRGATKTIEKYRNSLREELLFRSMYWMWRRKYIDFRISTRRVKITGDSMNQLGKKKPVVFGYRRSERRFDVICTV